MFKRIDAKTRIWQID